MTSEALVRECYHYESLQEILAEDVLAYKLFKKDGIVHKWLSHDVKVNIISSQPGQIRVAAEVIRASGGWPNRAYLVVRGLDDNSSYHQLMDDLVTKYSKKIQVSNRPSDHELNYTIPFALGLGLESIFRKAHSNIPAIYIPQGASGVYFATDYRLNSSKGVYEAPQQ